MNMSYFFKKSNPRSVSSKELNFENSTNELPIGLGASSSSTSLPFSKQILPSTSESTSLKRIERQPVNLASTNVYQPFLLEYALMAEFVLLHKQMIKGVYVVPSSGTALKWFGVLFIRKGIYQGGIFRFTLYIPDKFPDCDCPIIVFDPPVFHPFINIETGELDLKKGFPKWRRTSHHLWQVIMFARQCFYKIETHSPLNPEAASLYEKDLELFKFRVAENLSNCHESLYEKPTSDDCNTICFSPWDPTVHEEVRQRIRQARKNNFEDEQDGKQDGLSWVTKGTTEILSKKDL